MNQDGQISPHLNSGALSERGNAFLSGHGAYGDTLGNVFHCSSSADSLSDRGLHVAPLGPGSFSRQGYLTLAGIPELVGGLAQRPSKPSNSDSCEGRDGASRRIENAPQFYKYEWDKLINGAVFVLGPFSYLAYFVVSRDEAKKPHEIDRANS
jgi:hypothetical protein